jgi:CheY-like chemotaxis protein
MPPRILIAEDDELQSSVLRTALERLGYEAETVSDGLAAVCRLRTGRYDLALLDYHMPEVNGLTAARLLHDMFDKRDRPRLIGITIAAEDLNEKQVTCGGEYFDAVVSKRIGLPALLAVIDANISSAANSSARRRGALRPLSMRTNTPFFRAISSGQDEPFLIPPPSDGQVQVVSLAAFKAALGDKWERLATRAMMMAERILKRRLMSADVISRNGEYSFAIWFNSTNESQNETILAGAVREIRLRFLTQFGAETMPDDMLLPDTDPHPLFPIGATNPMEIPDQSTMVG